MNKNNGFAISNGNAGEYFVAGELERRGWSVAVPMSNVPTFDLLAIDRSDYAHQIAIQVKTTGTHKKKDWLLGKKNESITADNFFYVFVHFLDNSIPEYHIVPASVVAEHIHTTHVKWLAETSKSGKAHVDTDMRMFRDYDDAWKDRWDLLENKSN